MIKRSFLLLLIIFIYSRSYTQTIYNKSLLDTLNQITKTNTISKNFSTLYLKAIKETNRFAKNKSENVKQFVFRFETTFGKIFCDAHHNYLTQKQIVKSWGTYYKFKNLNEIQYQFIGMNAHINGDMHQGLIDAYKYDSINKYKHELVSFQKALNRFFDSVYYTTYKYPQLKNLHHLTLGIDRLIGKKMILHWRIRQINMALLFYKNNNRYLKRLKHVQKIINRWDRRAIKLFK